MPIAKTIGGFLALALPLANEQTVMLNDVAVWCCLLYYASYSPTGIPT